MNRSLLLSKAPLICVKTKNEDEMRKHFEKKPFKVFLCGIDSDLWLRVCILYLSISHKMLCEFDCAYTGWFVSNLVIDFGSIRLAFFMADHNTPSKSKFDLLFLSISFHLVYVCIFHTLLALDLVFFPIQWNDKIERERDWWHATKSSSNQTTCRHNWHKMYVEIWSGSHRTMEWRLKVNFK